MSILKGIVLPPSNTKYMEEPWDTIVNLEDYKDVELVPFSHECKYGYEISAIEANNACEGHLLAIGSDSGKYFTKLPCTDADIVVATDYFNSAHLPEGFSGAISYLQGYTPSADIMNAVSNIGEMSNNISVSTATTSPSFGMLVTIATVGLVATSSMVHKTKSIRLEAEAEGNKISLKRAIKQAFFGKERE